MNKKQDSSQELNRIQENNNIQENYHFKKYSEWTPENEAIFEEWSDIAKCYKWLHNRSHNIFSFYHSIITIPCIILSTIGGTASFAIYSFPPDARFYAPMAIGCMHITVSILTVLQQFFKFSERKETHRISAISWDKFLRNISIELAKMPNERFEAGHFLKLCSQEYDRLIEFSPSISTNVINEFNIVFSGVTGSSTRKRFNELKKPDICNSIISANEYKNKWHSDENKDLEIGEDEKLTTGDINTINIYIFTFYNMFGRKPITEEIIDNLKDKVNNEILNNFLEKYTIEGDVESKTRELLCN